MENLQSSPKASGVPASSPNNVSSETQRPQSARQLILTACRLDDISLISHAISIASSPDSKDNLQEILSRTVSYSIRRNATNVLTYVLEHGGKVPVYSGLQTDNPREETLKILLAHGWDINARHLGEQPFLWEVVGDGDIVAWCLEHGATVNPKDLGLTSDDDRRRDQLGCPSILESAAAQSTVATFELLRSRGAELGRRTLHFAARATIKTGEVENEERSMMADRDRAKLYSERMAMVVHLVDVLQVSPNALDQPAGWSLGNHWGTPLCYVALNSGFDCSEVVKFLLQRGADPRLVLDPAGWNAMDLAERFGNQRFLETVKDFENHKQN